MFCFTFRFENVLSLKKHTQFQIYFHAEWLRGKQKYINREPHNLKATVIQHFVQQQTRAIHIYYSLSLVELEISVFPHISFFGFITFPFFAICVWFFFWYLCIFEWEIRYGASKLSFECAVGMCFIFGLYTQFSLA